MKKYLQFGSFILGVGLIAGCGDGGVVTDPAPPTETELQEQAQEMDASAREAMSGGNYPGYEKSLSSPSGDSSGAD